jgi:hypothetical protein
MCWPFPHQDGSGSGDDPMLANPAPANLPLAADLTEEQVEQLAVLVQARLDELDGELFDAPNCEGLRFEARHCELAQRVACNAANAVRQARDREEEAIATAAAARAAAEGAEVAQGPQERSATRGLTNHRATRGLVGNSLRPYGHVWPRVHRTCGSVMSRAQPHPPSSWHLAQTCTARSKRANLCLTVTASNSGPH